MLFYWFAWILINAVGRSFFHYTVHGKNNIPHKTNYIVVGNHTSGLDAYLISGGFPRTIHWITSWTFFHSIPLLGWYLRNTRTIPEGDRSTAKTLAFLNDNKIVGLFPEGKCSLDGKLGEFRRGAALLALKSGRPIVPCAIIGAYDVLPWGARIPKRRPITVKIGKPVYLLKEFDEHIDDIRLLEGMVKVRNSIQEMLDEG